MIKELTNIYNKLRANQAVGIDGVSKDLFDENLDEELGTIERKVANESYEFSYYKQQLLIKSANNTREISIPTLRDKILINLLHIKLQAKFSESLGRLATPHAMIDEIKKSKSSYECFLKVDIKNFYPSINHELLLDQLQDAFEEEPYTLTLLSKAIKQSTISPKTPTKQRVKYANAIGVPQGLSISTTLAQIYIEGIDKKYKKKKEIKYFRFVDDILILCSKESIEKLQRSLKRDFKKLSLTIHEFSDNQNKSTFGAIEEPFEFLGYRFDGELITPRESSAQKMFENLNALFTQYKHEGFKDKNWFYTRLNFKITGCIIDGKRYGWIHYFSMINDHELLFRLDKFIENKCQELSLDYSKIKKYSRSIYEIRDNQSQYITSTLKIKKNVLLKIALDLNSDVGSY